MIETKEFSDIQGYWNSKGEDEIDIVAKHPKYTTEFKGLSIEDM